MILREETVVKRKSDMPFLDPEEFKPKLKEIFENVVIPQIKRANMKQTAVEWLVEQLDGENHLSINEINRVIEQAKEMEKEQIIEAANNFISEWEWDNGETYYNKTFKSE